VGASPPISGSTVSKRMSAESNKRFLDTNILLYLLSADAAKAQRAEELVAERGWVSVQVLNEFASVASRKLRMSIPDIRECLEPIRSTCVVEPVTVETHGRGLDVAERFGLSLYDSMIVAAALLAGCDILYSEDLQDGQRIDGLRIRNPFSSLGSKK
jgi:predicted nucleic acid-binding protein